MSEEIKNNEETSSETEAVATSAPTTANTEDSESSESRPSAARNDQRGDRSAQGDRKQRRVPRFRKKVCKFCHNKEIAIDYKKPDVLERFLTERGKILPRRITGTCAKHQRRIATEVKRARMIALLPFVEL
ncbi:MAG TPA: 30S ribosomal protein S18 [Spirochaetota bacterium]|nr:30S ribosomal protein S18 [Spirochaetota bacterium]